MPIFNKPNAIIYVRRNGLIVAGKKLTPARLAFNEQQLQNLEILEPEAFTATLRTFFTNHGLKGKHALMVLDDSVVFTKSVPIDGEDKPADQADAFIDVMPLAVGQRACLRQLDESQLNLYGTNGHLYQAIADVLDQANAKLVAFTPATAYPSAGGRQQLAAAVQEYVNDTTVRAQANFQDAPLV
jgi:hypothetical protein